MKEKDGAYIALMWDGKPEAYYIRGHILKNEACKELQSQQEIDTDDVAYVKQKYGRWGFSQHEDFNRNLYVSDEPSKGAFKITECVMKCL